MAVRGPSWLLPGSPIRPSRTWDPCPSTASWANRTPPSRESRLTVAPSSHFSLRTLRSRFSSNPTPLQSSHSTLAALGSADHRPMPSPATSHVYADMPQRRHTTRVPSPLPPTRSRLVLALKPFWWDSATPDKACSLTNAGLAPQLLAPRCRLQVAVHITLSVLSSPYDMLVQLLAHANYSCVPPLATEPTEPACRPPQVLRSLCQPTGLPACREACVLHHVLAVHGSFSSDCHHRTAGWPCSQTSQVPIQLL